MLSICPTWSWRARGGNASAIPGPMLSRRFGSLAICWSKWNIQCTANHIISLLLAKNDVKCAHVAHSWLIWPQFGVSSRNAENCASKWFHKLSLNWSSEDRSFNINFENQTMCIPMFAACLACLACRYIIQNTHRLLPRLWLTRWSETWHVTVAWGFSSYLPSKTVAMFPGLKRSIYVIRHVFPKRKSARKRKTSTSFPGQPPASACGPGIVGWVLHHPWYFCGFGW